MKNTRLIITLVAATTLSIAAAPLAFAKVTNTADMFVKSASVSNHFEVVSSQLAIDKSQDENVKKFAQQMIDDHTKAGDRLKEVVKSSSAEVQPEDDLDDRHRKIYDKLADATVAEFDKVYIKAQVDAHNEAVDLFSNYSRNGKDEALKNFATETLPTLKAHQKHVRELRPGS